MASTGVIEATDSTGDTKLMWDSGRPEEVKAAREHFDALKAKGFIAYKVVGREGTEGDIIQRFDPNLERIIMHQQHVGG